MKLAWWSWASGYQTDLSLLFCGKNYYQTNLVWEKIVLSDKNSRQTIFLEF